MKFSATELIERKRDGDELTPSEIAWLIAAYTDGTVADYQMAAMAMAVYLNGLTAAELAAWTDAMMTSGDVLDLSAIPSPKVDKHSTGGVGDKVSIPLAPIVASCGIAVPMMSGRGLGHTGGTLDKLESIPGFRVGFDQGEFQDLVRRHGVILAGQSERLVPADRALYALRDATGTVSSIPLIASSIMSKKLAEDLDGLVLDVKVGVGAFMEDLHSARSLAETMVGIGHSKGVEVTALLTDMSQPLGQMVGNSNEIIESIHILRGKGDERLRDLTRSLAAEMLLLGGVEDGTEAVDAAIESGRALDKFAEIIVAQGGDANVIDDPGLLPMAEQTREIEAPRAGHITECDARVVGVSAMRLGAGRARKEDDIDHGVGVELLVRVGDLVDQGQPLARITTRSQADADAVVTPLLAAWTIADHPAEPIALILDRITSSPSSGD